MDLRSPFSASRPAAVTQMVLCGPSNARDNADSLRCHILQDRLPVSSNKALAPTPKYGPIKFLKSEQGPFYNSSPIDSSWGWLTRRKREKGHGIYNLEYIMHASPRPTSLSTHLDETWGQNFRKFKQILDKTQQATADLLHPARLAGRRGQPQCWCGILPHQVKSTLYTKLSLNYGWRTMHPASGTLNVASVSCMQT